MRDFGIVLFATDDADLLTRDRTQAAYPDVAWLDDERLFCVYRQPDPALPDLRPGLTYSHIHQRYVAGCVVRIRS